VGLRIASEKQFDRYFGLSVPSDELSEGELQDLLAKMSDRNALQGALADLRSRGLLEQALDRLDYHRFGLDRTDPDGVLIALLSLDVHGQDGFFLVPFSPRRIFGALCTRICAKRHPYESAPSSWSMRQRPQRILQRVSGLLNTLLHTRRLTQAAQTSFLRREKTQAR